MIRFDSLGRKFPGRASRARGRGFKSLRSLGSVTAWGLTHRFFSARGLLIIFLAIKEFKRRCICHKGAGRAFAGAYTEHRPWSSFWSAYFEQLFSGWGWGRSKVWDLQAGTAGLRFSDIRKIPRYFFYGGREWRRPLRNRTPSLHGSRFNGSLRHEHKLIQQVGL
jgi:hypothetical protein